MGLDTRATAFASVALGHNTAATDAASAALGRDTVASGAVATAVGRSTLASGFAAVAMGDNTTASGALAFGNGASAAGQASVALGTRATTVAAAQGSFVFADNSSSNPFTSFAPGEFVVRASGGVGSCTNAATTTGAEMAPGGGSWATLSDANMKENFRDVAGEDVLAKLARSPIREWNYTSQDPGIRHMGPTAQDFRAAFGLGDLPLRINTTDADGVALAAVKALDVRTRALNEQLTRENDDLRARLARLELLLETLLDKR